MDTATGEPPSEFRIFKAGKNRTSKGDYNFTAKSAAAVLAAEAEQGVELCMDYNHAMFLGKGDPAEDGKSAAWYKLAVRNGELFATDVSWTPGAKQKLKDREYRYFSPAFNHDKNEITRLLNLALANIPAIKGLTPIVASETENPTEETEPPMLKNLVTLLSLGAEATESEALTEVGAHKNAVAQMLSATGKDSISEALGVVTGWKEASGQVTVLSQRIAALEGEKKDIEVKGMIDGAVKEGRVAPAEIATLSALGKKDFDMLKGLLSVRPQMMPAPVPDGDPSKKVVMLSSEQEKIMKAFGLTAEEFAKAAASTPVIPLTPLTKPVDESAT